MERASVIPDSNIIHIMPFKSDLQIMIIFEQLFEPLQEHRALFFGHAVNELGMLADRIYTLPARDRICTNDGMDSFEFATNVFRRSSLLFVELEVASLGRLNEIWAAKGARKSLQKFLNRW